MRRVGPIKARRVFFCKSRSMWAPQESLESALFACLQRHSFLGLASPASPKGASLCTDASLIAAERRHIRRVRSGFVHRLPAIPRRTRWSFCHRIYTE